MIQLKVLVNGQHIEREYPDNTTYKEIAEEFHGQGYGVLKTYVADVVCAEMEKIQNNYRKIMESHKIEEVLALGAKKASAIADCKLELVKKKIGLEIIY